jgi:competence protein ComFC
VKTNGIRILSGAARFGKPLIHFIRGAAKAAVDFVYPPVCLLCGGGFDEGRWLCPKCLAGILGSRRVVLHEKDEDFKYLAAGRNFDGIFTAWEFDQDMESLIHCIKYSGMKNLARFLGLSAGEAIAKDAGFRGRRFQWMVPVPLHKVRLRERGYNQSAWICGGLSEAMGVPVLKNGLFRKKYTQTQTGKTGEERQKNVRDAFGTAGPEGIPGRSILLVDDVSTTGSTINSCAGIFKDAGAEAVFGVTLARPLMGISRV